MARPLTKKDQAGTPYVRDADVEAQIEEVINIDLTRLKRRLQVTDQRAENHLRSECLVYLARHGVRENNQRLVSAVLPVLLGRCEANLVVKIPDWRLPTAAELRETVLGEFSEMFAIDGSAESPDDLDFFECKFNRAFRALRIDLVRSETARLKHVAPAPQGEDAEAEADDEALARVCDSLQVPSTAEASIQMKELLDAIDALPPHERDAVMLVRVMGYKEESEDPTEETAATRCNCTGRTIRNRLTRAAAKLTRFKERL